MFLVQGQISDNLIVYLFVKTKKLPKSLRSQWGKAVQLIFFSMRALFFKSSVRTFCILPGAIKPMTCVSPQLVVTFQWSQIGHFLNVLHTKSKRFGLPDLTFCLGVGNFSNFHSELLSGLSELSVLCMVT